MDDRDLELVLKSAGLRERPPGDVERAVREQLRAEWRGMVADRSRRGRQRAAFALAASILVAVAGFWAIAPRFAATPVVVASVATASGDIRVTSGWLDRWHAVDSGQALLEGQVIETGPEGRGALALRGGISARLDRGSRLVIAAADRLELQRGSIYVDSGSGHARATPLDVVTPTGSVRHVGTRYEVRLLESGVQVRVRDGTVEWRSSGGSVERGGPGQQLTISNDGGVERAGVPAYGAAWDWTMEVAPSIDIDGMPLSRFLAWTAHETGLQLAYVSPEVEREAAGIVVHGSIEGLTPPEALSAVLVTTSVRAQASGGSLVVDRR